MPRDLQPRTVYLPEAALAELARRAKAKTVAEGTLLRLIVLGEEPPLKVGRTPR